MLASCRVGAGGAGGAPPAARGLQRDLDVDAARDRGGGTVAGSERRRDALAVGFGAERVTQPPERAHVLELPRRDQALGHRSRAVELQQPAPRTAMGLDELEDVGRELERPFEPAGYRPGDVR